MTSFLTSPFSGRKLCWYGFFFLAGLFGIFCAAYVAERNSRQEYAASIPAIPDVVSVKFGSNYRESLQRGEKEGKPILLFFSEPGSPFSGRVRNETFTDKQIVRLSQGFICVEIDTGKSASLEVMKKYGVTGSPTVQFISSQGIPLLRVEQFRTPSEFKEQMEAVLRPVAWQHASLFLR